MSKENILIIQGQDEKEQGIYYEVDCTEEPLGEGGTGTVRRGFLVNERMGSRKEVAIKFLFDDLEENIIFRSQREASIHIVHENLVEMLGCIQVGEATLYGKSDVHYHVVSELLHGVMLFDVLKGKVTDKDGQIYPEVKKYYDLMLSDRLKFAVKVTRAILSGIMALHDNGYIHRDIDPSNVMITDKGKVKLIDFGIAKQLTNLTTQDQPLTQSGVFIGKASYASPELVSGDLIHQNESTDIYAIGILLYQLVTGQLPFLGPVHEVLEYQLKTPVPVKNIKDKGLRKIIKKATEKKQADRYRTAAELRVALDNWVPGGGDGDSLPKWVKSLILILVYVLAAVFVGILIAQII